MKKIIIILLFLTIAPFCYGYELGSDFIGKDDELDIPDDLIINSSSTTYFYKAKYSNVKDYYNDIDTLYMAFGKPAFQIKSNLFDWPLTPDIGQTLPQAVYQIVITEQDCSEDDFLNCLLKSLGTENLLWGSTITKNDGYYWNTKGDGNIENYAIPKLNGENNDILFGLGIIIVLMLINFIRYFWASFTKEKKTKEWAH